MSTTGGQREWEGGGANGSLFLKLSFICTAALADGKDRISGITMALRSQKPAAPPLTAYVDGRPVDQRLTARHRNSLP